MYLLSITATACKLYYNLMNKKRHFNTYLLSWRSAVRDCWFPATAAHKSNIQILQLIDCINKYLMGTVTVLLPCWQQCHPACKERALKITKFHLLVSRPHSTCHLSTKTYPRTPDFCTGTNIYTCMICTDYRIRASSTNKWLHHFVHATI